MEEEQICFNQVICINTYFGLSTSALASDDEFEVKEDATKAEIKRAFGKSLKGKKMNKKILSEFIELVA